ncbi:MAG: Gfo/Idh/MocA family oxidoreductase [Armatimonadota bacterium]|nr:Gfo/Idh/MocA family oxidoreductase [Armatimonadota bacterium]MCX7776628.1 Gfo/Idh/MocA family oxidoreductase [Armatimonadota bacterium]MDW8025229.1 Gfo/Idh/MocA family oxidoreductase [Armatimonadota bacterium]
MEKIGVGVIGVGTFGEVHALAYSAHASVECVMVCDIDEQRARNACEKYGFKGWTTDYRELLAHESIHAVSIATPDFAHRQIAVDAAEAKKHILVEKPLATSVEDCEAIIEAANRNGVTLMVDFHNRFNPAFVRLKEAIDSGELGQLLLIATRLNDTLFVPTKMLSWAEKSTVAWFLGSHVVDLVRWLTGAEVKRVYTVTRSMLLKSIGVDTPDFFVSTLEFDNGCVATIENCWVISERSPSVVDFKCEVVGTSGTVFIDTSHHGMVEKYTQLGASYPDVIANVNLHGKPVGFAIASIHHFVECLIRGIQPIVSGFDGLQATKVIAAMEESVKSRAPIEL